MSEVENTFHVRPKTVYIVTHSHSGENQAGVKTVGEFASHDRAMRIARALRDATPGAALDAAVGVKFGDIPPDVQHVLILAAVQCAAEAVRLNADGDVLKAARAVAEAGVLAWQAVNGLTCQPFAGTGAGIRR